MAASLEQPSGPSSEPPSGGSRPNVPVPDELYAVRQEIKRLESREGELRRLIIDNPDIREGASYLAKLQVTKRPQPDWEAIRQFHPEVTTIIAEYTYQREIVSVVLDGITEDGEIVSTRKLAKAD